jgi:hypothetical protein
LAAYQSGKSQDVNSIITNPSFVNTVDFILSNDSPCIDAGVDLGSSYDDAILVGSSWPRNISTFLQGDKWEIGAYVFLNKFKKFGHSKGKFGQ